MAKKKYDRNNPNPNCPVQGCQADQPHAQDPIVQALIIQFASPEKMTEWVLAAMAELFERERASDPDLDLWENCALACAAAEPLELV